MLERLQPLLLWDLFLCLFYGFRPHSLFVLHYFALVALSISSKYISEVEFCLVCLRKNLREPEAPALQNHEKMREFLQEGRIRNLMKDFAGLEISEQAIHVAAHLGAKLLGRSTFCCVAVGLLIGELGDVWLQKKWPFEDLFPWGS